MSDQTLTEALAELGITHAPSATVGKRDLFIGHHCLGAYDAAEGWELVREFNSEPLDPMRGVDFPFVKSH